MGERPSKALNAWVIHIADEVIDTQPHGGARHDRIANTADRLAVVRPRNLILHRDIQIAVLVGAGNRFLLRAPDAGLLAIRLRGTERCRELLFDDLSIHDQNAARRRCDVRES